MKIAMVQQNYHVGNFDKNINKIKKAIHKAKKENADIVIFPELAVCGYPPQDLLEHNEFVKKCDDAVVEIATECVDIAAVVGGVQQNRLPRGKKLFNSAFFLFDGKIQEVHHKGLLPTYDIFDEDRYFEPNHLFSITEYKGEKLAITICEDLWSEGSKNDFSERRNLYRNTPMQHLILQQPTCIINISASPFSYRQLQERQDILFSNAKKYNLPIIYVNQIGANTELIFDGGSTAVNCFGNIIKELKYFEEDFSIIDLEELKKKPKKILIKVSENNIIEKIHDALILGIRDYFFKLNLKKATLGLSGGIDSAITAVLAVKALGKENIRVLLMPSKYSSEHSITDAISLANNLGIQYDIINIEKIVLSIEKTLNPIFKGLANDVTEENIQARARGLLLMALSNKFGHILLNTSNKSEAAVGYGTLYGDMNGGLSVLGDVYKQDVFKLAHFINKNEEIIPNNTITKPPSAELRPDQKDADSLPDYDILDSILYDYVELKKSTLEIATKHKDLELVKKVIKMVNQNEYKRYQAPPILRISTKAFGGGRRIPLVAVY